MSTTATSIGDPGGRPVAVSGLREAGKIMGIAFQLALLILIIKAFRIQDNDFFHVTILTLFGFLINAFLPLRLRLPFFALFSLSSILLVLGLSSGLWLIAIGLVLIGICHLPIGFLARIGLLLAVGALLVALRLDTFTAPWSRTLWPILGSMFMFRLIIYLYDIKHESRSPGLARSLGYFFMAPNVCFPLFPIIDYKRFQRNYYNEDAPSIYQRGVKWIFRGIIHLLLYRFVYQFLALDPAQVNGIFPFIQYSLASFLLYLQVSGQFHLIVGILLLFGFNLPETHNLYYLASSFTDFWRRINIYWKDFVMKIFYYPVYFRLRQLGETWAIVLSTIIVFFATWFLHAYQWFWLRGTMLLEWHDALFWAVLAVLVVGNSLYEVRYGRDRALGRRTRSLPAKAARALSIAGTFITICLLWSMWSSDSLSQWLSLWATTGLAGFGLVILIPSLFAASFLLNNIARRQKQAQQTATRAARSPGFWRMVATTSLGIVLVYLVGRPEVYSQLPPLASSVAMNIQLPTLNSRDSSLLERGYYENLIAANRHSAEFWNAQQTTVQDDLRMPGVKKLKIWRDTDDMSKGVLVPNAQVMTQRGLVAINQWGMRDKPYEKAKPANTYRIALLGDSHAFGLGLANDEVFEAVLEKRLNNDVSRTSSLNYEILNFGVPGSFLLSQLMILDDRVLPFGPDAIFLMAHRRDEDRTVEDLAKAVKNGLPVPYEFLRTVIERAGVNKDMAMFNIIRRLLPFGDEILLWGYKRVVDICRENGIRPVWLFVPAPYERLQEWNISSYTTAARTAGFEVISLTHVYDSEEPYALTLPRDGHPNSLGHKLIADHLYKVLSQEWSIRFSKPLPAEPPDGRL
jgi:D-alanyl-lipoteichoic acid acyltransferase DltB (MBOAT superfamily)/lysophospholipase L1-like esterase